MRNQGRGMGRGLGNGSGFPNGLRRGNGFGRGRGDKVLAEVDESRRAENTLGNCRRRVKRNDGSCLSDGPGFGKGLGRGNRQNRKLVK